MIVNAWERLKRIFLPPANAASPIAPIEKAEEVADVPEVADAPKTIGIYYDPEEKSREQKLLYIVWIDPNAPATITETIKELVRFSEYPIDLVDLYPGWVIPAGIRLADYAGIIIHNTVNYNIKTLFMLDKGRDEKIRDFAGLKIMLKQDEAHEPERFAAYMKEAGFDLLLTICDEKKARLLYPKKSLPNIEFMQYLTGYVPKQHRCLPYAANGKRDIDIGYRGNEQPLVFGRLCHLKQYLGDYVAPFAQKRGLVVDVSGKIKDRLYGRQWFDFLGNCKVTLGVESGMDIVDKDGTLELACRQFIESHPEAADGDVLEFLAPFEGAVIQYRAISPRHFEAAACRSTQVLTEGEYQGIFKPDVHYIPLREDLSNIEEVLDKVQDEPYRIEMANRAFEEIILNPEYSFKTFARRLDERIERLLEK